jgi:probable rRNA maturation factor
MIEVVNKQRRWSVDEVRWQKFAQLALNRIGRNEADATIVFVSDRAMRDLNRRFRSRSSTTDVLSFPVELDEFEQVECTNVGDVVISVSQAEKQAVTSGLELENEIEQLILHGLLHLCGYDHETDNGEMNRIELRLRRRLGI